MALHKKLNERYQEMAQTLLLTSRYIKRFQNNYKKYIYFVEW